MKDKFLAVPPSRRHFLYLGFLVLALSGMAWLAMEWFGNGDGEAAQLVALKIHGAASMLFLLALGGMVGHATIGVGQTRNRKSGIMLLAIWVALILTAWLLYYGSLEHRSLVSRIHWGLGLFVCLWLPWHGLRGRRSRAQA